MGGAEDEDVEVDGGDIGVSGYGDGNIPAKEE
jgi:hypothetical protein